MKRPGWLRGESENEEERPDAGGSKDDSERAQRERLAKARRERQRKARADLAAKARDAEPEKPRRDSPAKRGAPPVVEPSKRERPKGKAPAPSRSRRRGRARGVGPAAAGAVRSVRSRAATLAPRVVQIMLAAVLAFFRAFFALLGALLRVAAAAWRFASGPLRSGLDRLGRLTDAGSRATTPTRVLAVVAFAAIVLLALSQFADYRTISIGNDSYAEGIQTVAPAPVAETDDAGSAHSYLMLPLAAVALGLLAAAMTGRWRLCRLIALAGVIAIAVALLHDRPTGLDTGDRSLQYEGVKATLVGGFYAQLAAGLLLTASSLLLGRELRPASVPGSANDTRRSPAPRRRFRLRRRAGVEGARA